MPRSRGFGHEKMAHRLIQLRLQALPAPVGAAGFAAAAAVVEEQEFWSRE